MKENNYNLFHLLIKHYSDLLSEKKCLEIVEKCRKFKLKKHELITGESKSNHNNSTYLLDNIDKNLKKIISEKINYYADELGIHRPKISNSWVNFQNKNSKLINHVHPGSSISGVLYLKVDENSSKIYFYNPNPYNVLLKKKENNVNNFEYIYLQPKIGDLILFPNWLRHGSHIDENMSHERVALSFNSN
jgi:uncharacterized protein (TIGR02466 family)